MGRGEGLVQVQMHCIEAHVAGPADAHQRVQVGAVVVELGAGRVHQLRHFQNLALEQAERVGVGQHQRCCARSQLALEVADADPAIDAGANFDDLESTESGAGGVGAMGAVRNQHFGALFTAALVIGLNHPQGCPLAVGAGSRLQTDPLHAHDRGQPSFQVPHQLQRALDRVFVLIRMQKGEPRKRGSDFVCDRVVLHSAAAERVEVLADRVVQRGEPAVVAHDLRLTQAGQGRGSPAQRRDRQRLLESGHLHTTFWQPRTSQLRPALFEAERLCHASARSSSAKAAGSFSSVQQKTSTSFSSGNQRPAG